MICFITGGAQGLGYAIAAHFVARGDKVCIMDRSGSAAAAEKLGENALAADGDVTSKADVDAAVARTIEMFGGIDAVVAAAGVVTVEPALDVTPEDFTRIMQINVLGSFLPAQAAARHMVGNGGGSIVLLGSVYGSGGAPDRTAYCASKGAIHNLTQSLATEWGPKGVRVNAVAPTGVRTPMVQELIDAGKYNLEGVKNRTPLGRMAEPEEVAVAAHFLASSDASMINGVVLPVDGGWIANGYTW